MFRILLILDVGEQAYYCDGKNDRGKIAEASRIQAIEIARSCFEHHKPVAAVCHGPQTLISAEVLKGKHATCYRSVMDSQQNVRDNRR